MSEVLRLHGVVLPDGDERDVFVVDGRIAFDASGDVRTIADGGWILPGLVDAHAHLAMNAPEGTTSEERVRASARAHLEAGVLAIREPGGPDDASAGIASNEGLPRIFTAGRFLAAPGGYIPGLARELEREDIPAAAGETARAGRPWVKLVADWMGPSGVEAMLSEDVIRAATEAAHAEGARVAVHATLDATVLAAVAAGVDSIEHGTFMSPDTVEALQEHGTTWVPTLLVNEAIPSIMSQQGAPSVMLEAIEAELRKSPAALRRGAELAVRILAGTDAGLGPHGLIAEEIWRLRMSGLDPESAVAAGSWDARDYLGLPGIEEDAPGDLVVFADDPRSDLETLRRPVAIVLDGEVVPGG